MMFYFQSLYDHDACHLNNQVITKIKNRTVRSHCIDLRTLRKWFHDMFTIFWP